MTSGIECHPRGGITVDDNLQTSASDVYAIGECASWKGNYYGLRLEVGFVPFSSLLLGSVGLKLVMIRLLLASPSGGYPFF